MKRFIVATDDLLFGAQPMEAELVPYQVGMQCWHWELLDKNDRATGVKGRLPAGDHDSRAIARVNRDRPKADRRPSS